MLGGMWAAAATAFVFRDTRQHSLSAGAARLIATGVSFALCLFYLWLFLPTAVGMATLLAAGTLIMITLDRRDDVVTTAITTIVVMVVAILNPAHATSQPLLRLFDTLVGIAVGVACKWAASFLRSDSRAMSPCFSASRTARRRRAIQRRSSRPREHLAGLGESPRADLKVQLLTCPAVDLVGCERLRSSVLCTLSRHPISFSSRFYCFIQQRMCEPPRFSFC